MADKVSAMPGVNLNQARALAQPVANDDVVTSLTALLELAKAGKVRSLVVMAMGNESVYYHAGGNFSNDSLTLLGLTAKANADLLAASGL